MASGNRDLMDILLHGEPDDSGVQRSLEDSDLLQTGGYGQQDIGFTSVVSLSGHGVSMQPPLPSPVGQQGSRFHVMSSTQVMMQHSSAAAMMQQSDVMSSQQYPPSSSSYVDYQGFPGYPTQRHMAHPQASSPMDTYQGYNQNGSFISGSGQSMGQFGTQNRTLGLQSGLPSQYSSSSSSVNFGAPNYYSEGYPSMSPKSPAAHQQMQGSGYPGTIQHSVPVSQSLHPMSMAGSAVAVNSAPSYQSSSYPSRASMSPVQKQMSPGAQAFFPSRSPVSQQIHSPPGIGGNFPGRSPTSPMAQPLIGLPSRSSTSPVSAMMQQSMSTYSMSPQCQPYPNTTINQLQQQQSSCMFAQRLEKMSAQHQYKAQMAASSAMLTSAGSASAGTTSGTTSGRRPSFPGQQNNMAGKHPMASPTTPAHHSGPVSPIQRSPPQVQKSPPPFKTKKSPPPFHPKKPPASPNPYQSCPPPGRGTTTGYRAEQSPSLTQGVKKGEVVEKSSMQKLEEVAEKLTPGFAVELMGISKTVKGVTEGVTEGVSDQNQEGLSKKEDNDDAKSDSEKADNLSGRYMYKEMKHYSEDSEMSPPKGDTETTSDDKRKETTSEQKESEKSPEKGQEDIPEELFMDDKVKKTDEEEIAEQEEMETSEVLNENSNIHEKEKEVDKEKEAEKETEEGVETEKELEKIVGKRVEDVKENVEEKEQLEEKVNQMKAPKEEAKEEVVSENVKNRDSKKLDFALEVKETESQSKQNLESMAKVELAKDQPAKDEGACLGQPSEMPKKPVFKIHVAEKFTIGNVSTPSTLPISKSGGPPTIQATVIAKGRTAQSNQQVLVAKTAGGQMYLIQGNVLIPVQNITVQQPKGEHGGKVICVNQGQGKASQVVVGNITQSVSHLMQKSGGKKDALIGKRQVRDNPTAGGSKDESESDDEIPEKMEIDLACREGSLLSPSVDSAEQEGEYYAKHEGSRSTVSIQTDQPIPKSRSLKSQLISPGFSGWSIKKVGHSGRDGVRTEMSKKDKDSRLEKSIDALKERLKQEQDDDDQSVSPDGRKRIGRPPGSKDKHKRKPYVHKKKHSDDGNSPEMKTPKTATSETKTGNLDREQKVPVSETGSNGKRPRVIGIPTVNKTTTVTKRCKVVLPLHSPIRTISVQPRGGVDGDRWACSLCGKSSNCNSLGVLYGPYKAKLSRERRDSNSQDCRSPEKVTSPGGKRLSGSELPIELEGTEINMWIHKDCGVWSQGVYMLGRTLHGLEQAVETAASHKCSNCMELGATLACFRRGCNKIFHFACARDSGCAFVEENFTIFCSSHKENLECDQELLTSLLDTSLQIQDNVYVI